MYSSPSDRLEALIKALDDVNYNTVPSKLKNGCISYTTDRILTEEEIDNLWDDALKQAKSYLEKSCRKKS